MIPKTSLHLVMVTTVWATFILVVRAAPSTDNHLVPVDPYLEKGSGETYRKLYEQKLFVTPGDVVRYVHLPGPIAEPEAVVSVYRRAGKGSGNAADYLVTATQPSRRLVDAVGIGGAKPRVDVDKITIRRWDAPLPDRTATLVHELWLTMLRQTKPESCPDCIAEGTVEIFSAVDLNGRILRASLPMLSGENVLALAKIGNLLIDFCDSPASRRATVDRSIRKEASALLAKVSRPIRGRK